MRKNEPKTERDSMVDEYPVTFKNKRQQQLVGILHLPGEGSSPPVILMAHGFTDDKTCDNRLFVKFARHAAQQGFAVFRFDFAGSGDSEGEFTDVTVTGEIQDLESAIEFVQDISGTDNSRIYLVGYSLGGAVASSVAARNPRIRGFVGWAPVSDPELVLHKILGRRAFVSAEKGHIAMCRNGSKQFLLQPGFFSDLQNHRPLQEVAKISPRPILLIQGSADKKVLPGQTEALFQAANEPKSLYLIKNAPHSFALYERELFEISLRYLSAWNKQT